MSSVSNKGRLGRAGFSLIELLAVLAIIGIMAVAGLPALKGLTGSTGRTGGINALMSAIDQARAVAIQSGAPSFLVFADSNFPSTANTTNFPYRAYAILRSRNPDLGELDTNSAGVVVTNPIQIGKWESLPQGVALISPFLAKLPTNSLAVTLPGETNSRLLPFRTIEFTPAGGLANADATNGVRVFEGTWNGSKGVPARANRVVDQISLSRFTGRAFLVLTNQQGDF